MAAEVDQELNVIHKFVRDKYEKRFPELESLVPNSLEYLATVKLLGNDISTKGQNKQVLRYVIFTFQFFFILIFVKMFEVVFCRCRKSLNATISITAFFICGTIIN